MCVLVLKILLLEISSDNPCRFPFPISEALVIIGLLNVHIPLLVICLDVIKPLKILLLLTSNVFACKFKFANTLALNVEIPFAIISPVNVEVFETLKDEAPILPVAETLANDEVPEIFKLEPLILPVAETLANDEVPEIFKLEPLILPVAETEFKFEVPEIFKLEPLMLPVATTLDTFEVPDTFNTPVIFNDWSITTLSLNSITLPTSTSKIKFSSDLPLISATLFIIPMFATLASITFVFIFKSPFIERCIV